MEPPISLHADAVRDEKVKVLRSLRPLGPRTIRSSVVRGQYTGGFVRGDEVRAYRQEPDVAGESSTETFVAMRVFVDSWRWGGVPFYVRAGKRLNRRATEVAIHFKRVPHAIFPVPDGGISPNVLTMRIQPDEQIALRFTTKEPGQNTVLRDVAMDFRYGSTFGSNTPEAYERLLLDAMRGDATLFTRADEAEQQWAFVEPILAAWQENPTPPPMYDAGSWGPEASHDLLAADGRRWRKP
jgi:glucose-6-phosphate 1-dehydrogenase